MTKRTCCTRCLYPQPVCVCNAIVPVEVNVQLLLLQHPKETKHAKNSARLLPLSVPECQILVGEKPLDFQSLSEEVIRAPERFAVFYPSDTSIALEDNLNQFNQASIDTLIFVDATWRKAYKMWQLNPWLHLCDHWHFKTPPSSQYKIRKTSVPQALSTLEAVAYALSTGFSINATPLLDLFNAMQANQLNYHNPQQPENQ